ncbi:ParB family protein [Arthrobacter tumbae]|uniref:ParB family protein n=1 Tax=Arthrobacter tumbae TaxID=163874 RepID=UPI0027DC96AB|nr:hypothetical protein [Arthrobacter tumbae]
MSDLIEKAVLKEVRRLHRKYNGGEPRGRSRRVLSVRAGGISTRRSTGPNRFPFAQRTRGRELWCSSRPHLHV